MDVRRFIKAVLDKDDGAAPQWRQDKHIGTAIRTEL